jgi:hypothetical protein
MRSPSIWTGRPPTGTGVQLTKVRPLGSLPFNVWLDGHIVKFCADSDEAFAELEEARA